MRSRWFGLVVAAGLAVGCGDGGKEATIKGPIGADRDIPPDGSGGKAKAPPPSQNKVEDN